MTIKSDKDDIVLMDIMYIHKAQNVYCWILLDIIYIHKTGCSLLGVTSMSTHYILGLKKVPATML